MNKELIERVALEVAKEMPAGFLWDEECGHDAGVLEPEVCYFADKFLSRIDAERGKDAKAFLITGTQLGMPYTDVTQRKEVIDRAHSLGHEVSPLFLSPTIPEGVALVGLDLAEAQRILLEEAFAFGKGVQFDAFWRDLIAAQGEK